MTRNQRTISRPATVSGPGVHSGVACNLRILPAPTGHGIRFRRVDLPGAPEIAADAELVSHADLARRTTLSANGGRVFTIEHVLSAAAAMRVDNLSVEMDAEEPPFLDGSALPFVNLIREAGTEEQPGKVTPLAIPSPIAFREGDAEITAVPSDVFQVTFFFTSDEPLLRNQSATFVIEPETYAREIAPARTFCFFHEIEALRKSGLIRGGNLSSAVVIGRKAVINDSLRFPDEPVRHKILDFVGDLALLGRPVLGHFMAWRSGHRVHAAFCNFLRKELAP